MKLRTVRIPLAVATLVALALAPTANALPLCQVTPEDLLACVGL